MRRARATALAATLVLAFAFALAGAAGCRPHAPPTPRRPIGAACAADADCGAGASFYCATDHPGGYCEYACRRDRDCPSGAVCVGGGLLSKGDCHRPCAAASDCRAAEGYRCLAGEADARHDFCDTPGRSEVARRLRGRAWRW